VTIQNKHKSSLPDVSRRTVCASIAAAAVFRNTGDARAAEPAMKPTLTLPKIVGPIPVSDGNTPFATTMTPGSYTAALMKEFDYIEEEYFLFGYANIYGPGVHPGEGASSGGASLQVQALKPLAGVVQPGMPYATRVLLARPRDNAKFSGRVHAYTFHNIATQLPIERNLLRQGDVVLGLEGCSGTRFGPLEIPSGGIAQLHKFNLNRYRDLHFSDADPLAWPDLKPGKLAQAFGVLKFGSVDASHEVFLQELFRSYAQAPDIMSQLAHAMKSNNPAFPFEGKVKRLFSFGASGGSTILQTYINYHHDAGMMSDARPPFDGYLVMVGLHPDVRPKGAVLAILDSEAEVVEAIRAQRKEPPDTDNPRFRYYQIPGTGHMVSAPLPESIAARRSEAARSAASVVPEGIAGLSDTGEVPAGLTHYNKINQPIVWSLWSNMYAWIEKDIPMPKAPRMQLDPKAPDGVARDANGNALGGLRTPWVDIPDATYIARISQKDPLRAGMRLFSEEKMKSLYGSREHYVQLVNEKIDQLVKDRWIMAEDAVLMRLKG
jgi:Alpha/beta hydrolase domain